MTGGIYPAVYTPYLHIHTSSHGICLISVMKAASGDSDLDNRTLFWVYDFRLVKCSYGPGMSSGFRLCDISAKVANPLRLRGSVLPCAVAN